MKRKVITAIGLSLLASLAMSVQASSQPAPDSGSAKDTKIVIAVDPAFNGTVTSEGQCTEGRIVKLLRKKQQGRDKLLGTTTTDADGLWTIPHRTRAGAYYAKVVRSQPSSGQFCGGDRSNRLSFG